MLAATPSVVVSIDDPGANLDEICAAVKKNVAGELTTQVAEEIIEGMQQEIIGKQRSPD